MRTSGIEFEDGSCPAIFYVPFIKVLLARQPFAEHEVLLKLEAHKAEWVAAVGTLDTNTHGIEAGNSPSPGYPSI